MKKLFTAVIPCLRPDLLKDCLDSLYKHTDNIFYVIVVDMTVRGLDVNLRDEYPNLMIIRSPKTDRYYTGNIGFQKASNIGIKLSETPYTMLLNDDVVFIHPGWWDGVVETFAKVKKATPTRPALLVNLASTKLPDWSVGLPKGQHHDILPFKESYTNEDWDFLVNEPHYVNEHLTIQPGSVIDGINLYASVIDTAAIRKLGLLDELWYPGSAGDYDLSCIASMNNYRCVSTTLSWVYHHWSVTFQAAQDEDEIRSLSMPELHVTDLRDKWGERMDLWGVQCPECKTIMLTDDGLTAICPKHPSETYEIPPNTPVPL